MFKRNMGTIDRSLRITVGIALIMVLILVEGPVRFTGLIGIVPILTAATGWCPIYSVFGVGTCPVKTVSS